MKNTGIKKIAMALTLWLSLTAGQAALGLGLEQNLKPQSQDFQSQSFDQALSLFLERDADQPLSPAQKRKLRQHLEHRIQLALKGPQTNPHVLTSIKH